MSGTAVNKMLGDLVELIDYLEPDDREELENIVRLSTPVWVPLPGPQTIALESQADVVFYGGAAGGGKTDLAVGLALTQHTRSIIYRRVGTELIGIIDRMTEILGNKSGFNGQDDIWRLQGRQIEFGSCRGLGDERKYQGRPHDLKVFDEVTNFLESQVRFLMGWMRSAAKGQRCRILFTGNPPTDAEGEWVITFFAPWLDTQYKGKRAESGEIRWFAMIEGKDVEVADGTPFKHTYESGKAELIHPQSRTFILSKVQDNAFLMATGYESTLQALPEPLRSQMLNADFTAGKDANPYQVLPTAWVEAAQARWTEEGKKGPMSSVGVDVARGGKCFTVISRRHGGWYDKLLRYPGAMTPDGPSVAAFTIGAAQHGAPIHVDSIGVGTSPVDHLKGAGVHVVPINGAETGKGFTDQSGCLTFYNMRAKLWWGLREKLDPASSDPIAIPPGQEIKADLCAPLWRLQNGKILIESKDDLIDRIGRSPDDGDAIVYCSVDTMKRDVQLGKVAHSVEYDPFQVVEQANTAAGKHTVDYDPYSH